jgi:anti-sigma regulatory factor (Ser/Thr protein kinase)
LNPATSHHTLRHDALFYGSEEELAAAAVPFVREGVEHGETVLVNTWTLPVTRLLRAVFSGEPLVQFATAEVYSSPTAVLDRLQRSLERAVASRSPGVRAIGYIDLACGRLPWQEWVRYEAAVNRYLADYPLQTLCPYDLRVLNGSALAGIQSAHPVRIEAGRRTASEEYVDPTELAGRPEYAAPPDPLQETVPHVELSGFTNLQALWMDLYPALLSSSIPARKVDDYVKAVGEVAMNAVAHGGERVSLRLWTAPDRVVCTVTDSGAGIVDPLLGYARMSRASTPGTAPGAGGLGIWAARHLCDLLDYHADAEGFTVRLVSFAD